ncbi:hypothetical protein PR048_005291 [Dryococelus australis]|uniref:Uncharacterized protein n=1 Tax=Dryococelus australis TaxID=614101 RepID=A0ABQ9I7Q4_9NEOP|nr:hypothetical protein PR048_005291 [Dryococelus australis]
MASGTVGFRYNAFKKYINELDHRNKWLKCEANAGNMTSVYCELCHKSETSLCELCNFNTAFLKGIKDSALKKDNCMHNNALNILNKPACIQEFFVKTRLAT